MTACVAIKIRYNDFSTHSKQITIPLTSNSKVLMEKYLHLFNLFYERGRKVRLIGIKFSSLQDGAYQINLFDDREKEILLYKAIDEMKAKHGKNKITIAQNISWSNGRENDPRAVINTEMKRKSNQSQKE